MASGIAYRRLKPAIYKLNVYPGKGPHASDWSSLRDWDHVQKYTTAKKKSGRKCVETMGSERLNTIALEIMHEIFLNLGLSSLENMRQLSSYFQMSVESLPAYRLLKQHASQTLRAIYLSGVASAISVKQLFAELRQPSCRGCDSFGPFLFLPSVSRCCENCLEKKDGFQLFPLSGVYPNFGISSFKVRNWLPVVRCPAGNYGTPSGPWPSIDLVSFAHVEKLAIKTHGNEERMREGIRARSTKKTRRLRRKRGYNAVPDFPMALREGRYYHLRRRCGTTDLPFWDSKRNVIESGVYCSACNFDRGAGKDTAFTLDPVSQHFEHRGSLKRGYGFGDRYPMYNSQELGLDFLVNEKGEIEPHPDS